jgi:hypothetical protein
MAGYGADQSLGYVVMSPGEGPRKVVVYAPVMQANLVALSPMSQQDSRQNLPHAYTVHCDEGSDWVMVLKSDGHMGRLEKQVSVAKEIEAISTRQDAPRANSSVLDGGGSGRSPGVLMHTSSDGGRSAGSALMKVHE